MHRVLCRLFITLRRPSDDVHRLMATAVCDTKPASVRRVDADSHFKLTFVYSSPLVNERRFNFQRQVDEKLSSVLTRIAQNVCRVAEKRVKKMRKKQAETAVDPPELSVELWSGGIKLSDDTPSKDAFTDGAELVVGGVKFQVRVNPPCVTALTLPKTLMAGFPVHPRVEIEFCSRDDCSFVWVKEPPQKGNGEWQEVSREPSYIPTADDIGSLVRVTCMPLNDVAANKLEATSTTPVEGGPGMCPFDRRHVFTSEHSSTGQFRVVTYNILADLYADSDYSRSTLFPTCPPYALAIDYRKQLLLKEITGYHSDVLCLQEVDSKVFNADLVPTLDGHNMKGVFVCKGGKVAEGLACFYNTNKFRLESDLGVILSEALEKEPVFADFHAAVMKNEQLRTRMMERTTAVQVVTLRSLEDPSLKLCIANTHLYFHPDADHIRLLQAGMCLRQLEQVVAMETAKDPGSRVAVLICGDFNSTPEYGVYQLMTSQFIPEDYAHWSSVAEEAVKGLSLSHQFCLESACGTPEYTNYTVGFNGCLDYVFADCDNLAVKEVVPLPSHEEVTQYGALPSVTMPSDHIALVCTLEWKNKKK